MSCSETPPPADDPAETPVADENGSETEAPRESAPPDDAAEATTGNEREVETPETVAPPQESTRKRFSRRLSPQAKKAAMLSAPEERVRVLIQLSAAADPEKLESALREQGADPGAWMEETLLLSAEIAAGRLEWLSEQPGVVYVEVATTYRD